VSTSGPLVELREQELLRRARTGDESAFAQLADGFRAELQLHCYRIIGSLQDAEDMVQETLLAAWRGLGRFEGRASVRSWLYRIATNRCLNALRDRGRRPHELPDHRRGRCRPRSPRVLANPSGSSLIRTSCSRGCQIALIRRPATRLARRSGSRSLPLCNDSHLASAPCSSCATS